MLHLRSYLQEYSHNSFINLAEVSYLTCDEWPGRGWLSYSRTLWQENLLVTGLCSLWGFTASRACVCELCVSSICGSIGHTHTHARTHARTHAPGDHVVNSLIDGHLMSTHTHTKPNRCASSVRLGEIYSDTWTSTGSNVLTVWESIMHEAS